MLASYHGIVRNGRIVLRGIQLPEGAEVIVVVRSQLPLEEQEKRLAALSKKEWLAPFDAYIELAYAFPAEVDIETIGDEELTTLVHEARK
jgi:hypothetical protein